MRKIYGFNDQNDFYASKQAGQWYRSITRGVDSEDVVFNENKTFVKIGELISGSDDKEAKGTEVVYDITARDWVDDTNGYIFDSDGVGNLYTKNIFSHLPMSVDEIVEVIQVPNSDDDDVVNMARKSSAGSSTKIYQVITANYTGDPDLVNLYTVREVDSHNYNASVVADPEDIEARVDGDGYPFGLVVGRTYDSFHEIGGVPALKAPEYFDLQIVSGGWRLFNSHQGTELKTLAGADVEVLTNPTIDITLYEGIWFHSKWDLIRGKLTTYIPTL